MDPDGDDRAAAVRVFVAVFSLACTIASVTLAVATKSGIIAKVTIVPPADIALFVVGVIMGTVASILLVMLLSQGNPGITMVILNGGTNLVTYLFGAFFYGALSWKGMAGVLLITAGAMFVHEHSHPVV
jgi:uncharacterized membrane protein